MVRRIAQAIGLALLVALLLGPAFWPEVLQAMGDFLVIRDPLAPADAVIAISGDGTGERASTAAILVWRGYGRWLILSGSGAGEPSGGATAAMLRHALKKGVPPDRILLDDRALSTMDNARNSVRLMEQYHLRRAIVVTSPYHTRRAAWAFRSQFLPRSLGVRVYAVEHSFFNVRSWWTRDFDRWLVQQEYLKLAAFALGIRE